MSPQELTFTIRLDDGSTAEARAWDPAAIASLRKAVSDTKSSRKRLRVRGVAEADTAGHVLSDDTVPVSIALGYDVEGHTLALRFPSAEEAKRFQKRLIVTGVLAATIVAGAAGANLASQQARSQAVAPAAGPAITVQAPSSRVTPASIDARLRDASAASGTTTISSAKDAKDALASGGSAATTGSAHDEAQALKSPTQGSPVGGENTGAPTNQTYPK